MRVELLELHLFLTQFIDIKFSLTYCLVHIVCLSLRLLLLLEHHKNILNIFQCNELPALLKCGRSCIPLLGPGFLKKWRIIPDNYPQYPYTIWWHIFCKSRYCFVEGIDITFWFLPIIFADLVFWEKLWILSLSKPLTVDPFPMVFMRLKLRTCLFLELIIFET